MRWQGGECAYSSKPGKGKTQKASSGLPQSLAVAGPTLRAGAAGPQSPALSYPCTLIRGWITLPTWLQPWSFRTGSKASPALAHAQVGAVATWCAAPHATSAPAPPRPRCLSGPWVGENSRVGFQLVKSVGVLPLTSQGPGFHPLWSAGLREVMLGGKENAFNG